MYRILILDDEIPSAKMIEQLLNKYFPKAFEIFSVQSVAEASAYLNKNQVDLVFLDVELKGESGFDLLDKVAIRNFDVICLSASNDYAIKAFEYCANGYLLKPVNKDELIKTMSILFQRHQKISEI